MARFDTQSSWLVFGQRQAPGASAVRFRSTPVVVHFKFRVPLNVDTRGKCPVHILAVAGEGVDAGGLGRGLEPRGAQTDSLACPGKRVKIPLSSVVNAGLIPGGARVLRGMNRAFFPLIVIAGLRAMNFA